VAPTAPPSTRELGPERAERDPEIAVAVVSHHRPVRLRWLLNALEEQTPARSRWEVVVAHDSVDPETEDVLRTHPLAAAGSLRHVRLHPGSRHGRKLNAAWRATSAPNVLFTDDGCRPPGDWLERALEAVVRHPGAIIQGATFPDPDEIAVLRHAPWVVTQSIRPPQPWAQACNIVYPRAVLEAQLGFDESMRAGEDADLAARARATGVHYEGAPEMVTWHAVDEGSLRSVLQRAWTRRDVPALIRRHPELRGPRVVGRAHTTLVVARRGRGGALAALPRRAAVHLAEIVALGYGSVRHR